MICRNALTAALLLGGCTVAHALQPPAAPGAQGSSSQASTPRSTPVIAPEARALLERELEQIRAASSVRGVVKSVWEIKNAGMPAFTNTFPIEFALAKPDRLWFTTKDYAVWGDGSTLVIRSIHLKQFIRAAQPPARELRSTIDKLTRGGVKSIPGEAFLRPDTAEFTLEDTIPSVRAYAELEQGEHAGRAGTWIVGTGFDENAAPGTPDYPVRRFIASDDGMTAALIQDWTAMYNAIARNKHQETLKDDPDAAPPREIELARWTTSFERTLNQPVSEEQFSFIPEPGDREVPSFVHRYPGVEKHVALMGTKLPDISGVDLDGKPVNLSSYRGKVLVLDFWATWCGPCVQGMPSMQALYDTYGERGVVIMGVNRDASGKQQAVKSFLGRKGFTMPQFDDSGSPAVGAGPGAKLATMFDVHSIPLVMIIDREGVIQDIDIGYLPGKERELEAKLLKLLDGKALHTPEERAMLRELVGAK